MIVCPPSSSDRRDRWWGVFRAIVLVGWLVMAVGNWWTAPRWAGYAEAKAAVAEKRLTAYQWGAWWDSNGPYGWFDGDSSGPYGWFGDSILLSDGTQGPIFAWRTGDGRVWWTDAEAFDDVTIDGILDKDRYSGPGAAGIARELTAAGLDDRAGAVDARNPWITGAGAVITLVFLGVVIAGPAPVLGTRWFWFWLTVTTAYGLGLVFWLFRDRPWSRAAGPAREARSEEPRDRGWQGLLFGIVISFALSIIVYLLHSWLGDQWVPQFEGR